jgi:hypothetical protein
MDSKRTNAGASADGDDPVVETLSERLLRASGMFARSAGRSYSAEAWEVFYLHLATATEQLLKAVLARSNPLFIADARTGSDSMLHLAGMSDRAATPAAAVRTITVGEALGRINRIVPGYSAPDRRSRFCSRPAMGSSTGALTSAIG